MKILLVNLYATFFRLFEWLFVAFRYYRKPAFLFTDLLLAIHYLWRNPHQVSKNLCIYGETPLTTLDRIARECRILSDDKVYELGCGSGRTLFWLRTFVKCQVVGIDFIPTFIRRADKIKKWLRFDSIDFKLRDLFEGDYADATVVYLYGTCLEDGEIERLIDRFSTLKPGTRVITVSYPLTDYSTDFTLVKQFSAHFPWGKAAIYLNHYKADA